MWTKHPSYVKVQAKFVEKLRQEKRRFRRLPHVVFLCGGLNSAARPVLHEFLLRGRKHLVFYAEPVWNAISKSTAMSALQMENQFAELADVVMIVVESPGTFAELGAFAVSDKLRKKLLLILDKRFAYDASFINTGPVHWANADSMFRPAIYTNLESVLVEAGGIEARLSRLSPPVTTKVEDLSGQPKHFLFFVCDLVTAIGPAPLHLISAYLDAILAGQRLPIDVDSCVELGCALGYLRRFHYENETHYTSCTHENGPFHRAHYLNLARERAVILSVMQGIRSSRDLLLHASRVAS